MITDALLQLASAQAFSATGFSTNTVDLGNPSVLRNIGDGKPLVVLIAVTTAADATDGNETYQFDFVQSSNANLSSPDVLESRVVARGSLTLGTQVIVPIPQGSVTKRYIGMQLTLGGTTPSISVTMDIMPADMIERFTAYAKGYTIS
jgi:hypothetical protein